MPRVVAYAVVREEPPRVFVAEDVDTLQWVLALQLVAVTDPRVLSDDDVLAIRASLLDERWSDAVLQWMSATSTVVDVYPSHDLYEADDVDLGPAELQFRPLFRD